MNPKQSLTTFFGTHGEAEVAIKKLLESGYDMKQLSVLSTDIYSAEHVIGYYNVGDRMKKWGSIGAFLGGFWGLFFGFAFVVIPGIGPLLIGGPIVAALLVAIEGAVALGGISALGAALVSLGIPEHKIIKYETEIRAGKYMLVVHGSDIQLEQARQILELHIPKEVLSLSLTDPDLEYRIESDLS